MQVATVPVQICMGTVACAYNFLTIFSFSSLYLSLSLSLSQHTTLSFFLSSDQSFFLSSIFLLLAFVDRHRRRCRRRSLFLPLFLVVFELNGLLNSGFRVECLSPLPSPSPSPSLAFGGVDLVSRSRHRHRRRRSCCSGRGVDFGWVVWIVLLGLFRFWVVGLCCWVMLISSASILLLGLFF